MLRLANSFWVLACKCLFHLFGFIVRYIFRLEANSGSQKNDFKREDQIASGSSMVLEPDGSGKKENLDFFFRFPYPTRETENSVLLETSPTPNTSNCQVTSGKYVMGFMEEPEIMSFTIQELFVSSNDAPVIEKGNQGTPVSTDKGSRELHLEEVQELVVGSNDCSKGNDQTINRISADEDFPEFNFVILEKAEDSIESSCSEKVSEKPEQVISIEYDLHGNKEMAGFEHIESGPDIFSDEVGLHSENQLSRIGSHEIDSVTNSFFSDSSEDEGLEPDNPMPIDDKKLEFLEIIPNSEEISIGDVSIFYREIVISTDDAGDTDDKYIDLDPNLQCSIHLDGSLHSEVLGRVENKHDQENLHSRESESVDSSGKYEEPRSQKKPWHSDSEEEEEDDDDDDDEFDILLKHQDLIEQMKMEMKNARTKVLPTILEESEIPKMVEDFKPLKIDEKLEHKDQMKEIQKVYKCYAEKMRKLDILNYQTLHAISFLQLKDPVQQALGQKSSVSAIKSLLLPNLWPCKLRRIYADPALKSIIELNRKLEMVYVGQVCLSWEILHWQYGKAKELVEYDSEGHRPYNQVANEFQQLQVLVQRFVENDTFQGPRVQNYAKNRCEVGTLLHVPVIKDDCLKDKKDSGVEGETVVSLGMLTEIIDESMRVFWEFLRTDKEEANMISKGLRPTHVDLQDPSDSELLMDIKTSLQKKEKRLKDILRSGNCIVKKFQKDQVGRTNHALLFAQVELKLVSRVLNMSRLTTDQLVWCQKKLSNINFFSRKIIVEPSFLLFPF